MRRILIAAAILALSAGASIAIWIARGGWPALAPSAIAVVSAGAVGLAYRKRQEALRHAAARAERGDYKGAGELLEQAGQLLSAARSYARAGEAIAATRLYLAVGRGEEASLSFGSASPSELIGAADLLDDANVLIDEGLAKAAAAAMAKLGRFLAPSPQRTKLLLRAAQLWKLAGNKTGAAECLVEAGDFDGAAALLPGPEAAQLYFRQRQWRKAREAFIAIGNWREAAAAAREEGEVDAAAELFERAGDIVEAARTFLDKGRPLDAAAVHRRAGASAAAVDILAGAGLVTEARDLLLQSGDLDGAVELLVRLGKTREAAEILEKHGETRRAAVLLAKSGDLLRRAQLLEGEGDLAGAAQTYLDMGRALDAREILAEISNPKPRERFLFARALLASGEPVKSAVEFSKLVAAPGDVPRADAMYGQARALEAAGRVNEAVVMYGELGRMQPGYRDAGYRMNLLRARLNDTRGEPAVAPTLVRAPSVSIADPLIPPEWRDLQAAEIAAVPVATLPGAGETSEPWSESGRQTHPGPFPQVSAVGAAPRPIPLIESVARDSSVSVPSRYQIEKEVGRGGMGVVYQATDQTLGRTVALKVLSQALSADENARELFFREARAVAQLIHPNIVTLFDAGAEGGQLFLVFEFLHGPTLRSLMKNPMPPRQFAHLGAGVADALAYAHSRGIVHRDVKPENVVIAAGDVPKLTDFGVAHVASEKHGTTKAVMGTPNYMAPEQIRGGKIGSWTDVYALGAVLYECATAQVVFPAGEPMFHHVYTPPADPRVLAPTLSVEASELILRCLAKDPEARPGSAGEVATRLREIVR